MAKTKWRTKYVKKKGGRRKSSGGGKQNHVINGLIAGAGGQIATRWLGDYGIPAGAVGVGWWKNDAVLLTEGSREIGILLAQKIPILGGGGGNGGGAFE